MKHTLNEENRQWLELIWKKIQIKLSSECDRIGTSIPYVPEEGKYIDMGEKNIYWWTNGFWPGMLWQMYHATGEGKYKAAAEGVEARLDAAFEGFTGLHHDVGFMWLPSAVANFRLTGNERSKARGMHAAQLLAGRYNPDGKFIRSLNPNKISDRTGWVIIDSMMNIQLLHWAFEETHDPRFKKIAMNHADTTLKYIIREDGSSNHIAIIEPETGEFIDNNKGQGFDKNSSWSRGQAWAIYGMALSYRHTGKKEYLDAAKKAANYFIANVILTDYIPLVDFRAPEEPVYYDTTAGVAAARGMLEIAEAVSEYEKPMYLQAAINILKATEKKYCNWNPEEDSIVAGGSRSYGAKEGSYDAIEKNVPIIYGDYFFIEAILRLLNKDFLIW